MNTDTIFKRYWSALCAITDEAHGLDDGSVRLALRMAIDDTAALASDDAALVTARNEAAMLRQQLATERAEVRTLIDELAEVRQQAKPTIEQRVAEDNAKQIIRINEWLAMNAHDFYRMPGDTATAVIAALCNRDDRIRSLLGEVSDLNERIALSQAEVDRLQLDMTRAVSVINMETAQAVANNFTTQQEA